MANAGQSVVFRAVVGLTFPFTKTTYDFANLVVNQGSFPLAPCYEKVALGFSMAGNSGTFGVRIFWNNAAWPKTTAYGIQTVTAVTGIGASSGSFSLAAAGFGNTTFHGTPFPTPTLVEIDRAAGASVSGTLVIGGYLFNPFTP